MYKRQILYIAQDLEFHTPEPDSNEELILRKLPFEELYRMVMQGEILDSLTVAAVLKLKLWLLDGKVRTQ